MKRIDSRLLIAVVFLLLAALWWLPTKVVVVVFTTADVAIAAYLVWTWLRDRRRGAA